jgi:hypothetical protein
MTMEARSRYIRMTVWRNVALLRTSESCRVVEVRSREPESAEKNFSKC